MLSTLPDELAEDGEFIALQLFARAHDNRKSMMRIKGSAGVAGEMFAATQDAGRPQRGVEVIGVRDDLCRRAAVTAPAQGIISFVVEGNVQHRAEIEIEAEEPKQPSGDVAMPADESGITLIAELASVRRFIANKSSGAKPCRPPDRS